VTVLRKVSEDEVDSPAVDVFLLQTRERVLPECAAERALVIAELDDRDLCVGVAENRVIIDGDEPAGLSGGDSYAADKRRARTRAIIPPTWPRLSRMCSST
jgi:hypothetical protein